MLWYTQLPVDGEFLSNLLPGYLIVGIAIPCAFIPISIAALAGIQPQEAGLASGLINTSQQIGGAIGTAVASTIFITRIDDNLAAGMATGRGLHGRLHAGLLGHPRLRRARRAGHARAGAQGRLAPAHDGDGGRGGHASAGLTQSTRTSSRRAIFPSAMVYALRSAGSVASDTMR